MNLLGHALRLLRHHPETDRSAQVDAAFRDALAAQERTTSAAGNVVAAAGRHRDQINATRRRINERSAEHEQRWRAGQTSHVAEVVEDALRSRAFGGQDED